MRRMFAHIRLLHPTGVDVVKRRALLNTGYYSSAHRVRGLPNGAAGSSPSPSSS